MRLILFKIAFDFFSEDLAAVREQRNGLNVVGGRVTGVVFVKTGWK